MPMKIKGFFKMMKSIFFSRILTGDETWIHHWDPETKQNSMQWKHKDSPPPKKFKTQPSAGQIMASIFWDNQGVLVIKYMPHKTTITRQVYADTLKEIRENIKEKKTRKVVKRHRHPS